MEVVMKVYLFDANSGLYEGEDFWDTEDVREAEGATSVAPPMVHMGRLPVFDRTEHCWKLVPTGNLNKAVGHND